MIPVFFTLCLLGVALSDPVASQCMPCRNISMKEDIDWYRMNSIQKPWYDIVDIPAPHTVVDCYNWDRFTPVEDGVVVDLSAWTPGGQTRDTFIMHFIRVEGKTGIYRVSHEHRERFAQETVEAARHKADDEMIEGINLMTQNLFDSEFYFITDYDNYFIPGICIGDGGT